MDCGRMSQLTDEDNVCVCICVHVIKNLGGMYITKGSNIGLTMDSRNGDPVGRVTIST